MKGRFIVNYFASTAAAVAVLCVSPEPGAHCLDLDLLELISLNFYVNFNAQRSFLIARRDKTKKLVRPHVHNHLNYFYSVGCRKVMMQL